MRAVLVVVSGELAGDAPQVPLIHDHHVVELLPAQRPHQPFGDCVRPRRGDRHQHRLDANPPRSADKAPAVGAVAIADQVPRPLPHGVALIN